MANRDVSDHYPRRAHARGEELLRVEGLGSGALRDISFVLRRGEILGIAGLVGAGRTRLARAIVGADRVDRGRIVIRGKTVRIGSPADAARARIGFLPGGSQAAGARAGLSRGTQHLDVASRARCRGSASSTARSERREAQQAIVDLRIRTPGPEQRVVHLSGGNQQKVVLAKWLAARADIFDLRRADARDRRAAGRRAPRAIGTTPRRSGR